MYTDASRISKFLNQTVDEADVELAIAAAKDIIDSLTGRRFGSITEESGEQPVSEQRVFDGNGRQRLLIDDAIEITEVALGTIDEGPTAFTTESILPVFEPANHQAIEYPITALVRRTATWPYGLQNVRVTGVFAFSLVPPADIILAATVLAAGVYGSQRAVGDVQSERIGNYSVTYSTAGEQWSDFEKAKATLDARRRLQL